MAGTALNLAAWAGKDKKKSKDKDRPKDNPNCTGAGPDTGGNLQPPVVPMSRVIVIGGG